MLRRGIPAARKWGDCMFPERCKAVLKTLKNDTLEVGTACVSVHKRSADFVAGFVPLLQLGSMAKLVCVEADRSTHVITGQVYLSSPTLLRLVNIQCVLLPGAEQVLTANTDFPAKLLLPVVKSGFLSRSRLQIWQDCNVLSISLYAVTLRTKRVPDEDDLNLRMRIAAPVRQTPGELFLCSRPGSIRFGKQAKYNFTIQRMETQFAAALADFIRSESIRALGDTL